VLLSFFCWKFSGESPSIPAGMFFKLTMSLVGYSLVEFLAADLLDLVVSSA